LESHKMMVKEEFKGVVGINVLYFIVWYAFLIRQTTTRRYLAHKQKKEDDKKKSLTVITTLIHVCSTLTERSKTQ